MDAEIRRAARENAPRVAALEQELVRGDAPGDPYLVRDLQRHEVEEQYRTLIASDWAVCLVAVHDQEAVVALARRGLPNLRVSVEDTMAGGDLLAARLRWRSTDARGRTIERETIDILRFAGGGVVEHWGTEVWSQDSATDDGRSGERAAHANSPRSVAQA